MRLQGNGAGSRAPRRYAFTAALGAFALVVAGCGGGGGSDDEIDSGGQVDGEGKTLDLWIMEGTNPNTDGYVKELTTAFKDETGADLEVQVVPWADAKNKFNTAIAGGTAPDVAEVGTTWTPEYAEAGALVDLTDPIAEAGLDGDLVEGLVEAGTVDGGLYGMPWYAGVRSFVYRTDIFDKAGVEPPTSWDELVQVGEKVKAVAPKGMLTLPIPGDNEYGLDSFVWGAGGEIATQDGETWTAALDSDEAQEATSFYTGLATEHGFSTPAATTWDEADTSDVFTRGDAAMMIAGSWTPGAIVEGNPELKGKIGAFPIPGQDSGMSPSFVGGSHLGVFTEAEDKNLAFALVELMATEDFAQKWADETGFFPGTNTLMEKAAGSEDPLVAPFAKQMLDAGASLPVTPKYGAIQEAKTSATMLQEILAGKKSVAEASEAAVDEMNDIFAK